MQGFLLFREGRWSFRRKIPVELRRYFNGSDQIWRSLKTAVKADALIPWRDWSAKTDRVFQFLKSSAPDEMKLAYIASEISPSRNTVLNAPPSPAVGLSVSKLIEKFIAFKKPVWTSLKSRQENEFNLGLFVDIMGDMKLAKIDYETIEAYRDKLSQLPANHTRFKKYKTKTAQELIAMPETEKDMPKAENTNKHLGFFSTMLSFAVQRQFMTYNPATGINLKSVGTEIIHASGHKLKYTNDDLQHLIQLLRWRPDCPAQFYVPLIGIFTGCRRGEICQL